MAQLRWLKTCLRQSPLLMVARTTRRRASFGAVLDRNGLRPGRYYVTTDDRARADGNKPLAVLSKRPKLLLEYSR
jgi:Glutamine amidotransferases class-II